jgi:TatD DNase family protein
MLIDIHTHKSSAAGTSAIYNIPLADVETFLASDMQAQFSTGIHPCFIDDFADEWLEKMKRWLNDSRFVAIGECGLDKNSVTPLEKQIEIFEKQIALSEERKKTLIIHCVGRFNELFELKKQLNPQQKWIIHGFRGKPQMAKQALKAGCYLSFGEHFNPESVRITPPEKLFVETDESELSIEEIYEKLSESGLRLI